MAEDANASSLIKNPVFLGMIGLLLVLVAVFAGNFYLLQATGGTQDKMARVASLSVLAGDAAKHAAMAAAGDDSAFGALAQNKGQFGIVLEELRSGASVEVQNALGQVSSLWQQVTPRIDSVLQKQESIEFLKETSADININMQLIQQENNKIVRALVRANTAPNEIVTAQRQTFLIERMGHTIDKLIDRGSDQSLQDQFQRDRQTFSVVLRGFQNGDTNLVITAVTDEEIRTSLTRIEELFGSVRTSADQIIERSSDITDLQTAVSAINGGVGAIPPAADGVATAIAQSSGGLASVEIALGLGAGILIVFLVIAILIHRQSSTSVSETTLQNEENQAAILQLLDELADLADGDLRVQATVTESFTGAIADSINFSIDQMRGLVSKINETSGRVSSAAEATKKSVSQLSEASQRQAKEIADVSEAVNEMAVSIDMVSSNAAESSSVAERSVDIASKGSLVVQNTIDGMDNIRGQIQETAKRIKRLGESSQEIGDIVALINDIADQTNILSLNAAIQASMAGDAGKGFAVVADEVQRLAERSGAAAKQISALVKTIQSDTNEAVSSMEQTTAEVVQGTRLAQDAGVALGEIEGVSKSLAEIIENISDAARQQAASAGKISNTMKSIQEITSATTDGTKETATAVGNLADMTNELRSSVSGFKLPE